MLYYGLNIDVNSHKTFVELLSSFHIHIWDQIHHYLIHVFEIGLRKKKYDPDIKDLLLMMLTLMMNGE